jgi:hypothetical protein
MVERDVEERNDEIKEIFFKGYWANKIKNTTKAKKKKKKKRKRKRERGARLGWLLFL